MNAAWRIRHACDADLAAIAELFTESIHGLAGAHYDVAQRAAWAPRPPDLEGWRTRLAGLRTLLAEDAAGLLGFLSYEPDGHIDLLYTAATQARRGVATALLQRAEREMGTLGADVFHTEASLVAQPFFARHGYAVVAEEVAYRQGLAFRRLRMNKRAETIR